MNKEKTKDYNKLDIPVGKNDHYIHNSYTFWVKPNVIEAQDAPDDYKSQIENIGSFKSVEGFWTIYSYLPKLDDINYIDYYLFRNGIPPLWEHPANENGGRWVFNIYNKTLVPYLWEELLMAVIGEQFDVGMEICGVCLSIRPKRSSISVWNRQYENHVATSRIKDLLVRILDLPNSVFLSYRKHKDQMKSENITGSETTTTNSTALNRSNSDHHYESNYNKKRNTNKIAWRYTHESQDDTNAENSNMNTNGNGNESNRFNRYNKTETKVYLKTHNKFQEFESESSSDHEESDESRSSNSEESNPVEENNNGTEEQTHEEVQEETKEEEEKTQN